MRLGLVLSILVLAALPAAAHADAAWTCSAGGGWVAGNGQHSDAPSVGGEPCPVAQSAGQGATTSAGNLAVSGTLSTDGGTSSQTTDARRPRASVSASSLTITSSDGKLTLNASKLGAQASGSCDANRRPTFTSAGTPGTVTLIGRPIDTSQDYSEPGLGANGAPLFGKITIHFNEVTSSATGISRRAIHLVVTDRDGAVVFEAVAGQVSVGSDGSVCDPPPVCPAGQEPQAGHCVDITVTPLPQPPAPAPPVPSTPGSPSQPSPQTPATKGCRYADARSNVKHLVTATLCLLNLQRKAHHLPRFRMSADLSRAAGRHGRDMVVHRYFAHTEPAGATVLDRILRSGYMRRFGRWTLGENLGWGRGARGTPRAIVIAWMHSAPHRRNILDRGFRDIGIAAVAGAPGRRLRGGITYVLDLGGFRRL